MISERAGAILVGIADIYSTQFPAMIGLAALFTALSILRSQASSPGKVWWRNPGLATDICYATVNTVLTPYLRIPIVIAVTLLLYGALWNTTIKGYFEGGHSLFGGLPFWQQAAIYLLLMDFFCYWIHRVFHGVTLWPFHAPHHSAQQVDWTTTYRFHPLNVMLQPILVGVLLGLLGISPKVMAFLVPWDILSGAFVHANVKWTLGPLKYVIATPAFHRWHHCLPNDGCDTNFAPTFAFYDVMFGTFRMPKGKLPQVFGVADPRYPQNYIGQQIYPFTCYFRRRGERVALPEAAADACGSENRVAHS